MRGLLAGSDFAKQVQGVFPACGGYRGMSENHCESVVYSLSMRGYRHRNRNGGAFVMCPYKQMGLFTIKESYFLDNPLSAIFCLKGYSHRGRWEGNLN